jgi:predicted heme/steroid binding protein
MSEEHEHKKEGVKSEHYEHAHKEPFKKLKKNYLVAINIVLAILVVILLILVILPYTNYSANYVGKKFVSYINANAGAQLEFVKAKSYGKNLYEVSVSYNGREVLVYVAKDGKIYSLQLANLLDEPDDVDDDVDIEIPKSDKPIVELFVMSYCPYGTQAEKGIIPVYELLGSKIDSSIKFVHYILHGEKETQENYRQICIRE